jgi:outer membrane protein OmpA-like peptidoglycan-associated protein
MENILEITRFAFQGDAMQRLSSVLHESPGATKSGIEAAIPASLAGLAAHATSEQKAADLLGAFRGGDFPHADAGDVTKMVNDPVATARMAESGQGFLNRTFGGRLGGIVDALAGHTGVSRSSASTLLGLAAPLVLHAVSKEAESRNLDARGLSRFLADQGRRASGVLPASMTNTLSAIPGFGALGQAGEGVAGKVKDTGASVVASAENAFGRARDRTENAFGDASRRVHDAYEQARYRTSGVDERRRMSWLLPLLVLGSLLALLLFRARAREPVPVHIVTPTMPATPRVPEVPHVNTPSVPAVAAPALETLSPATGATAFASFLAGSDPTPRRFVLQGVEFATGSSAVSSNTMLNGVADALNSHPSAKVRIEGHTDATGSTAGNEALSSARAEAVKSYLIAHGVDGTRMETVGKASEEPVVQTGEANQENRRVDMVVTER